jgi:hypothetical protein
LIDRMPDEISGADAVTWRSRAPCRAGSESSSRRRAGARSAERRAPRRSHHQLRDTLSKTSILVTHDIADAFKVGNSIAVLNEGRIVFDGTAADLDRSNDSFIHQFLAPFRTAVAAAAQRLTDAAPRPASAPPLRGGTP